MKITTYYNHSNQSLVALLFLIDIIYCRTWPFNGSTICHSQINANYNQCNMNISYTKCILPPPLLFMLWTLIAVHYNDSIFSQSADSTRHLFYLLSKYSYSLLKIINEWALLKLFCAFCPSWQSMHVSNFIFLQNMCFCNTYSDWLQQAMDASSSKCYSGIREGRS